MSRIAQSNPKNKISQTLAVRLSPLNAAVNPSVLDTAIRLTILGFNVLPIPHAKKGGWPWKPLQYTKLHPAHLQEAFEGECNIAVMMGRTSGNLFVLDCETNAAFKRQGRQLRQAGIPIWAVRSGGKRNGGHYYLRCADGEVANLRSNTLKNMEIRGTCCYVLAPPSIHPDTGRAYQWSIQDCPQPPVVHIEDLHWLPLKLAHRTKAQSTPTTPFSPLSRQTQDFINNGANPGERNNRLFAAACDMAGNDYDSSTIKQTLVEVATRIGLSSREIHDTLHSALSQPREPSRKDKPNQPSNKPWYHALSWAKQRSWTGRTGQTDRAVFLACVERARVASNPKGIFRASVREIAELARINKETASKALKRLQQAQYIRFNGHDSTSRATLWSLDQQTTKTSHSSYTNQPWSSSSVRITDSDAAEWRALGKTASVVCEGLQGRAQPVMPKALAERCLLTRQQVQRGLRKLAKYGLARRVKKGWVGTPVDEQVLKAVAERAGTLGQGEKRKTRHAEERALHAGRAILEIRSRERWLAAQQAGVERVYDPAVYERPPVLGVQFCEGCGIEMLVYENPAPPPVCNSCAKQKSGEFLEMRYCQHCGQGVMVFEGNPPPRVCGFCVTNYGRKEDTVWLSEMPPGDDSGV